VPESLRATGGGVAHGKCEILKMVQTLVDGPTKVTSIHHAHQPEIVLLTDDTATGIRVLEDRFWWQNGDVEEHFHGFGLYHETHRRSTAAG
jgi:hypothetical protein